MEILKGTLSRSSLHSLRSVSVSILHGGGPLILADYLAGVLTKITTAHAQQVYVPILIFIYRMTILFIDGLSVARGDGFASFPICCD